MKMSDVFDYTVKPLETLGDASVSLEFYDDRARAAAHAISVHDELVDAVDVLLNHPYLADRDVIHDLLTRAKGGYE